MQDPNIFDALLAVANNNPNAIAASQAHHKTFPLKIDGRPLAVKFLYDAKTILGMAQEVGLEFLLDDRLPLIVETLEQHPVVRGSPKPSDVE